MKSNSIKILTSFAISALVGLLALSCTRAELEPYVDETHSSVFEPVGNPVEAYLDISVGSFSMDVSTRSEDMEDPPEDTDDDRRVNNIWVFQYDASVEGDANRKLVAPPQYVEILSQGSLSNVPVTLFDNDGKNSIIYAVTNTNSSLWVQYDSDLENYPGFDTPADLMARTIPAPNSQRMKLDYDTGEYTALDDVISVPMNGKSEEVVVEDQGNYSVPVQRLFAKLMLQVNLNGYNSEKYSDVVIYDVSVGNIPFYCTMSPLWDEDNQTKAADYSECTQWVTRAFSNNQPVTADDEVYPYVVYVPENIQGENGSSDDKSKNIPPSTYTGSDTDAMYVETSIYSVDSEDGVKVGPYTFRVYPGGDSKTNFNVRRNCVYKLKLTVKDFDRAPVMDPSANCIVCLSGETTAFYPYYRTETGGGYKFTDYLNPSYGEDGDEAKRIAYVQIIWQSRDGNTGDGTGYIGDNSNHGYVWIDDPPDSESEDKSTDEYWRRIYVKVGAGKTGNALIGAYNSDKKLIWSWHIWSRLPAEDPTNLGNAVTYMTYDWDSSGIKNTDARIEGYTVMDCNLGALHNEPDNVSPYFGMETFGTLYQWGRKDPFPPVGAVSDGTNFGTAYEFSEYNSNHVGMYYGYDGTTMVGMIGGTTTEAILFHSAVREDLTKEGVTDFDDYIKYSIENPTVFICGTIEANVGRSIYTDVQDQHTNEDNRNSLNWNYPSPHDGNWLSDSSADHYNRLWGGLDPEGNEPDENGGIVSKSYDTGLEDALGQGIHMYDDYGTKSIFDPCPYGWRVSPPDLWLGFTETGLNPDSMDEVNSSALYYSPSLSGGHYTYGSGFYMYMTNWGMGATSYFPCQGTRAPDGSLCGAGSCGNYHNATADMNDRVNILHVHDSELNFKIFENEILHYYLKSCASAVRCVKDDSVINVSVD
ncbi:MAG: hypothetical protein LUC18_00440 [Porphyromonadaceae bacterium]|nr:hypothetical protein [Porphyromonadaceae bacterium]